MKKLSILILVLNCIIKVVRNEDSPSANEMQKWIRNRGTFYVSLVNMSKNIGDEI